MSIDKFLRIIIKSPDAFVKKSFHIFDPLHSCTHLFSSFFVLVFIWTHVSVLICTFFFSCVAVLLGKSGNTGEKRPLKLYTYHAFIDSFVETCSSIPSFTSLLFYLLPLSKCFRTFQSYKQKMIQKSIKTLKQNIIKK